MTVSASSAYRLIFDRLGIQYTSTNSKIERRTVLRDGGESLRLYFNDATKNGDSYFAASRHYYEGYSWRPLWRQVAHGKQEPEHFKVVPATGSEAEALRSLLAFARRQRESGEPRR